MRARTEKHRLKLVLSALVPLFLCATTAIGAQELAKPPAAAVTAVQSEAATTGDDDPLVTDRPDATESAETVRPGRVQVEGGYTLTGIDEARAHALGEVLFRVGLADRLEFRVGLDSFAWVSTPGGSSSGLTDTSIGFKFKLHEGGATAADPTVAILASTSLPTGADEFSRGVAEPAVRLAAAWDLSDRVSLSSNIGWAYLRDRDTEEWFSELAASVALGYGISDRWGAFLEYFGFYPATGNGPAANFVDTGLTYLVTGDLQLDGRVGYGLNRDADDFFVGFGTTVRW